MCRGTRPEEDSASLTRALVQRFQPALGSCCTTRRTLDTTARVTALVILSLHVAADPVFACVRPFATGPLLYTQAALDELRQRRPALEPSLCDQQMVVMSSGLSDELERRAVSDVRAFLAAGRFGHEPCLARAGVVPRGHPAARERASNPGHPGLGCYCCAPVPLPPHTLVGLYTGVTCVEAELRRVDVKKGKPPCYLFGDGTASSARVPGVARLKRAELVLEGAVSVATSGGRSTNCFATCSAPSSLSSSHFVVAPSVLGRVNSPQGLPPGCANCVFVSLLGKGCGPFCPAAPHEHVALFTSHREVTPGEEFIAWYGGTHEGEAAGDGKKEAEEEGGGEAARGASRGERCAAAVAARAGAACDGPPLPRRVRVFCRATRGGGGASQPSKRRRGKGRTTAAAAAAASVDETPRRVTYGVLDVWRGMVSVVVADAERADARHINGGDGDGGESDDGDDAAEWMSPSQFMRLAGAGSYKNAHLAIRTRDPLPHCPAHPPPPPPPPLLPLLLRGSASAAAARRAAAAGARRGRMCTR